MTSALKKLAPNRGLATVRRSRTSEPRYRAGGSLMASLKHLLCCSLILATAAILCSGSIARAQTPEVKPKPTGSISGRVTVGGNAGDGIPVVAIAGQSVNRRDAAARSVTDSDG